MKGSSGDYYNYDTGKPQKESCCKRCWCLWFVLMIVFIILTVVATVMLFVVHYEDGDEKVPEDSILECVTPVDGKIEGAAQYHGKFDKKGYKYHRQINFYNKKPTDTIVLLQDFKTYQQTNGWSCGAAAALMVLNYYGEKNVTENDTAHIVGYSEPGATPTDVAKAFKEYNYTVETSDDNEEAKWTENGQFAKDLTALLNNNEPLLIKLGGHWSVIIGYDNVGTTDDYQNHVIILADSWDTHDFHQDGYIVYEFDYFWNLWTNSAMKRDAADGKQRYQQYVYAKKKLK